VQFRNLTKAMLVALCSTSLVACYSVKQALHQNDLMNSRVKIEQALANPELTPATKAKLRYAQTVLNYADQQGLNAKTSYRYFIDMHGKAISYTVQAAEPFKLKSIQWWFPFVGHVPYLGYFHESERDAKAQELSKEGYDVESGIVGAFSLLGWFEDPIYSSMLKYTDEDLAHLLFHELTHRTVWIKGSVEFNENLAEFVGEILTAKMLSDQGQHDKLAKHQARRSDRILYRKWIKSLREALGKVYEDKALTPEAMAIKKQEVFDQYTKQPFLPDFKSTNYDFIPRKKWNNASVLGASMYLPDYSEFQKAFDCSKSENIGRFLELLEAKIDKYESPEQSLSNFCENV
jgi:predicted aminopeptidase